MLLTTLMLATLTGGPTLDPTRCELAAVSSDTLRATWDAGVSFGEFLAAAEQRRDQWIANYSTGAAVDATLVSRAAAVAGHWYLLVVAVDSCSDSVSTVPWIAKLVDQLPEVELRVIGSDVGKAIMEAYRTPDGRAATPTVVLLDEEWNARGCFVERPPALRAHLDTLPEAGRFARKMDWYQQDAGRETVRDIVAMLETAAAGGMQCR